MATSYVYEVSRVLISDGTSLDSVKNNDSESILSMSLMIITR